MIAVATTLAITGYLLCCLIAIALSGIYSGSETGIYSLSVTKLRLDAHDGKRDALRLERAMADRANLLFATLVGTNIANYFAPFCLTAVFVLTLNHEDIAAREQQAELYATLILTPLVFIFGEVVPKNLFHSSADVLMRRYSRFITAALAFCRYTGISHLQRALTYSITRILRGPRAVDHAMRSRAEIYQLLREGAAEGIMSSAQRNMMERIHRLNTMAVREVMVPLRGVVSLSANMKRADIEDRLSQARYSRLPVFKHKRDKVVGVVHMLEILYAEPSQTMEDLSHPAILIPDHTNLIDALATLQEEYARMAIVTDPRGRCAGIVTVKDLVEEITGEIQAF